jgi:multidrug efflux pump subunit AcrA (membrane-fusion protein)
VSSGLFRAEALEHHARREAEGDVLRVDRRWTRVTYGLLVAAALATFLFISLFSVDEYASGPAVVRVDGRRVIAANAAGTVEAVDARAGAWVERDGVLLSMRSDEESSELARATSEFDRKLVQVLRDPSDTAARQALAALRTQKEQARIALESRTIRAPAAGYIGDVRVRTGQHVNAGDVLLAVAPRDGAEVSLVSMVSADYRPMLKNGLKMRFELDGFRYEYADLDVSDVSEEAVGTAEVQRLLGQDRSDIVSLAPGAKILVTAKLPAATFTSEGQSYGYSDGLTGVAEIRVRREPILVTLAPVLRRWLR